MVKRLLNALEYPQADSIDLNNETTFRKLIIWLETNKINKSTPELSNSLKNINAKDWPQFYNKYKQQIQCPTLANSHEEIQWLLGYAVQLETHKKRDVYIKHAVENMTITTSPNVIVENPLDKLNFHSQEFKDGITNLAKILQVNPHPNPSITLKAVAKVIQKRLSLQALENPNDVVIKGTPFPIQDADLGFDLKDPVLNQAAKILRLLYIHDLRQLQTRANELIVAVQNITANPKTDTKLGKVGK